MPNGVQEIYSKTGIISKYLLHKTYRCAKLYSKIWALNSFWFCQWWFESAWDNTENPRILYDSADFLVSANS